MGGWERVTSPELEGLAEGDLFGRLEIDVEVRLEGELERAAWWAGGFEVRAAAAGEDEGEALGFVSEGAVDWEMHALRGKRSAGCGRGWGSGAGAGAGSLLARALFGARVSAADLMQRPREAYEAASAQRIGPQNLSPFFPAAQKR